jgi:hypothetical protein
MGLRSVLQLFVYLISEGFSHSGFIFQIPLSAYLGLDNCSRLE